MTRRQIARRSFDPALAQRLLDGAKPGPRGCLLWQGFIKPNGYVQLSVGDSRPYIHRLAYELWCGPIPAGMEIRHTCDVRHCIRLRHIKVGTHAQNMADMKRRRRHQWGERHWNSKLSAEQARSIFADKRLQADIAADHGVSQPLVSMIKNGHIWLYDVAK